MIGNGQKFTRFWYRIQGHFNETCPINCAPRSTRSLKTKWGIFKHVVAKFIGNYTIVIALCEFGIGTKDTFQKALILYKMEHLKHKHPPSSMLGMC